MGFDSPAWLIALLPWMAVGWYLLRGRGPQFQVPFIGFWKNVEAMSPRAARRRWPPFGAVCAWIGLLLAVLSAAKPVAHMGRGFAGPIVIVLDRGATMAAVLPHAVARADELAATAKVTLIPVPGQPVELPGDAWESQVKSMSPTAIDTQTPIEMAVANQLRHGTGPIVVLSNRAFHFADQRVLQFAPPLPKPSVAITAFAARALPKPQLMVRLENRSDRKMVRLKVTSGGAMVEQEVPLPPNGRDINQFIDMPTLDSTVTAEIEPHAANDPWATAWLVRQSAGVKIVVDVALSPSIQRMATVFAKDRPAAADAPTIVVTGHTLDDEQSGVWISESPGSSMDEQQPIVSLHVLTRAVTHWPPPQSGAAVPAGFTTLVSAGMVPIVACREAGPRQVWINANFNGWDNTPDFVIFFGNVFSWLGAVNQEYAAASPAHLGDDWTKVDPGTHGNAAEPGEWPGIYRSVTGQMIAINTGAWPTLLTKPDPHAARITGDVTASVSLVSAAIYCGLAASLLAAASWPVRQMIAKTRVTPPTPR